MPPNTNIVLLLWNSNKFFCKRFYFMVKDAFQPLNLLPNALYQKGLIWNTKIGYSVTINCILME